VVEVKPTHPVLIRGVVAAWLLALIVVPSPVRSQGSSRPKASEVDALYIVGRLGKDFVPKGLEASIVQLPSAPRSNWDGPLDQATMTALAEGRLLELEVLGPRGALTFRQIVHLSWNVHGEFPGRELEPGRWSIDRVDSPLAESVFVARVPSTPDGVIRLSTPAGSFRFPIASLTALAAPPQGTTLESGLGTQAVNVPDNRVDLLVMGDGYRSSEQSKFVADASAVIGSMFSITPYSEYENYVRVRTLFTPSSQSGADHPPYSASCQLGDPSCCTDPDALSDPKAGQFVSTAFDAHFCSNETQRLLTVDVASVMSTAHLVPGWDQILVIVNDPVYGGAGGDLAVLSLHPLAVDIAQHEYGHSFTHLADEYDSAYPGYPQCSDLTGSCEANVTDETNPALIKWAPWIQPGTPIPTPEGQAIYEDRVGLFEGARYQATGMYRPRDTHCLMHCLGEPFCEICTQGYILRLYSGGWGTPRGGIETIEPGQAVPGWASFRKCPGTVALSVVPLSPSGGPSPSIQWSIDGVAVPGATSRQFTYSSSTTGTESVAVAVKDETSLVHPAMEMGLLTSTHAWSVDTVALPANIALENETVSDAQVLEACDTISAGPATVVSGTGELTLRAGTMVVFGDGFSVLSDGRLTVVTGPVFPSSP